MTHLPPDPNKISEAGYSGKFDWMNEQIYEPAPIRRPRFIQYPYAIGILMALAVATGVLFAVAFALLVS